MEDDKKDVSEILNKHKALMIKNGMAEEAAEEILVSFKARLEIIPPNYPIPKCSDSVYNDPVLDWINQYALSSATANRQYTVFTSVEDLKKVVECGLGKKCYVRDYSGYLVQDGTIFFIFVYCADFKQMNNQSYKIIFSSSQQSQDIFIQGQAFSGSYFVDVDAIRLNKFLKVKELIIDDFDFDFEVRKSWEEALMIFRSLFV
ncbi:MAG: hypothetical protein WCK59_04200 [Candidatus Falkowbacteria bacterium]